MGYHKTQFCVHVYHFFREKSPHSNAKSMSEGIYSCFLLSWWQKVHKTLIVASIAIGIDDPNPYFLDRLRSFFAIKHCKLFKR